MSNTISKIALYGSGCFTGGFLYTAINLKTFDAESVVFILCAFIYYLAYLKLDYNITKRLK